MHTVIATDTKPRQLANITTTETALVGNDPHPERDNSTKCGLLSTSHPTPCALLRPRHWTAPHAVVVAARRTKKDFFVAFLIIIITTNITYTMTYSTEGYNTIHKRGGALT
ncbi:hypothetical protein LSH36_135g03038 [Paralvinella palmiformis]|uniref:Uncharacterized protein n=1 Tax=Paralvinella palmiformis TaxID=53620 RepID=A0AAD9JVS3_9ANNE|nr:hypothetical protein LSH36_135g03038 [Paralvinella palmiformis]